MSSKRKGSVQQHCGQGWGPAKMDSRRREKWEIRGHPGTESVRSLVRQGLAALLRVLRSTVQLFRHRASAQDLVFLCCSTKNKRWSGVRVGTFSPWGSRCEQPCRVRSIWRGLPNHLVKRSLHCLVLKMGPAVRQVRVTRPMQLTREALHSPSALPLNTRPSQDLRTSKSLAC
jgi:hypothetical protein